jgi:N-acetyl-anhydromuramyl-L-alanine amidase AmpD
MIAVHTAGMCINPRVRRARRPAIERGAMGAVAGIIVHQTGAATSQSSLASYQRASSTGAHFLIDRDGAIYRTASLHRQTWHVGRLRARCLMEHRCTPVELKSLSVFSPRLEDKQERSKPTPDRFPSNQDSIGIELVGEALPRGASVPDEQKTYQLVSDEQNASLKWLIGELTATLAVPLHEVFRHPDVSRKNPTEARSARW